MIFSENCKVIINNLAQRFGIIIDWTSEDLQISIQNLFQEFADWQIKLTWGVIFMQMFMIVIVLIFMDVSNEYKKVCNETRCSNFLYNFSGIYVIKRTNAGKILNIAFNCLGVVSVIVLFVSIYHLIKLCSTPTICALEYIQNMM